MRKLAATALALPVLATLYVPLLLRRSIALRLALGIGLVGLVGLGIFALTSPRATTATVPSPVSPLDSSSFAEAVDADHGLHAPATIQFANPMDKASVAAALTVDPVTPYTTSWDSAGKTLTISPQHMWQAGTYYTIKVAQTAHEVAGQALAQPAHALFSTRAPTAAHLALTHPAAGGASPATGFTVSFDGAVTPQSPDALLAISPTVSGSLVDLTTDDAGTTVTFQPDQPLAADTSYTIAVQGGLLDSDGANVVVPLPLRIKTAVAPGIVRFRPLNGAANVSSAVKAVGALHPGHESKGNRPGIQCVDRGQGDRRQGRLGRGQHRPRLQPDGGADPRRDRHDDRVDRGSIGLGDRPRRGPLGVVQDARAGGRGQGQGQGQAAQGHPAAWRGDRSGPAPGTRSRSITSA